MDKGSMFPRSFKRERKHDSIWVCVWGQAGGLSALEAIQ